MDKVFAVDTPTLVQLTVSEDRGKNKVLCLLARIEPKSLPVE